MPQPVCSELQRLERFLCLGKDSAVYHCQTDVSSQKYSSSDVQLVKAVLHLDNGGALAIGTILSFSRNGRAAVRHPALFALAVCARCGDQETKNGVYDALSDVCHIPTDLFYFLSQHVKVGELCDLDGRGWGRAIRRALSRWYLDNPDELQLARHVTKYPQRHRWRHLDVLRVAHIKTPRQNAALGFILEYIRHGLRPAKRRFRRQSVGDVADFLTAVKDVKSRSLDEGQLVSTIRTHRLNREHILTEWLSSPQIWKALLPNMPVMAMIRNLGRMTSLEILKSGSDEAAHVISRLQNRSLLMSARLHPFYLLHALRTYNNGHGDKGRLVWKPNSDIVKELELAFNQSFTFTEPTGQRFLLAVDITTTCEGCHIDPSTAAAVLAMQIARRETEFEIVYFTEEIIPKTIDASMQLTTVMQLMPGSTDPTHTSCDCSKPIRWALDGDKDFDVFIIFTSCRTVTNETNVMTTLLEYRQRFNTQRTKLVVVTMSNNDCIIGDDRDHFILNVVGFDINGLELINDFIRRMS